MRVNLCVFNLLIITSLFFPARSVFPEILSKSNPSPICGTPQLWNRPVEVVFLRYLAKPVEGDTTFWIREDIFSSENDLIEVPFYRLFENEVLTFHIGMEIFKGRASRDFFRYNRKQFWKAMNSPLKNSLSSKKLPYNKYILPIRIIRYGLQPSIPIRLVLKLETERILSYFRKNK